MAGGGQSAQSGQGGFLSGTQNGLPNGFGTAITAGMGGLSGNNANANFSGGIPSYAVPLAQNSPAPAAPVTTYTENSPSVITHYRADSPMIQQAARQAYQPPMYQPPMYQPQQLQGLLSLFNSMNYGSNPTRFY